MGFERFKTHYMQEIWTIIKENIYTKYLKHIRVNDNIWIILICQNDYAKKEK